MVNTGFRKLRPTAKTSTSKNALNYDTMESILGHILKYTSFVEPNSKLAKQFEEFVSDLSELMQHPFVDSGLIAVMKIRGVKLIQDVDTNTNESQDQEELLGYLRRLVSELAQVDERGSYNFEPCPPRETQNNGCRCLMQQFENIKDTLRNKSFSAWVRS